MHRARIDQGLSIVIRQEKEVEEVAAPDNVRRHWRKCLKTLVSSVCSWVHIMETMGRSSRAHGVCSQAMALVVECERALVRLGSLGNPFPRNI